MDSDMENRPISKSDFIQFMATGSPLGLVNDHQSPVDLLIHPLLYSPDFTHFPDLQCVPLLYKVRSNVIFNAYKEVRR